MLRTWEGPDARCRECEIARLTAERDTLRAAALKAITAAWEAGYADGIYDEARRYMHSSIPSRFTTADAERYLQDELAEVDAAGKSE